MAALDFPKPLYRGESMEVYTYVSNPFRMGGPQRDIIKTEVEEYHRVSIGQGYFAIIFENKIRGLWHFALEDCGALIMTDNNKEGGLKKVRQDVETGDLEIMKKQIKRGKIECTGACLVDFNTFCSKFK
jgi:hypothetical protein